jgi:hypothetical protein
VVKDAVNISLNFGTFIPSHTRYTNLHTPANLTCSTFLRVHVLHRQEAEMLRVTSQLRIVLAPHITSQWHDNWHGTRWFDESLESYQHCQVTHSAPSMGNQRYTRDCWAASLPGSRHSSLINTTLLRRYSNVSSRSRSKEIPQLLRPARSLQCHNSPPQVPLLSQMNPTTHPAIQLI